VPESKKYRGTAASIKEMCLQ